MLLTQYDLSCPKFVQHFKVLGQVVHENSLTKKNNVYTSLRKRQKLYTPYVYFVEAYNIIIVEKYDCICVNVSTEILESI